ncbi:hypothetical protein [Flagellimonas pacifica]|uniref:Uncharacterized protein n=1 Tax=Flagellimonas pacifica TaxID=1247520 RepID=A0A285MRU9_9FLAO|nr:hypothetical protein [Allomuricauda parva]SNY99912.1 hypothetical protein SAMN06265377_1726 [Allomuricauda parva]
MKFLNKEIETLVKNKKSKSLVKRQISCGIFQDLENYKQERKNTFTKS